jgi:hypothetical protein
MLACDFDSLRKKKIATKPLCLTDEGINSSGYCLIEKKWPRIIRMSRIITNKISNIDAIRGKIHLFVLLTKEATHYVSLL